MKQRRCVVHVVLNQMVDREETLYGLVKLLPIADTVGPRHGRDRISTTAQVPRNHLLEAKHGLSHILNTAQLFL